jgi:SAM-dependent methyltransferase
VSEPIVDDSDPAGPTPEERRLSFGSTAAVYAAARPGYPTAAIHWVVEGARVPVRRVADVGAGTGALTRALVTLVEHVTVFEPDDEMLAQLRDQVPGVEGHVAPAESLPVPDGSLDAVLAAQAWHWFDHAAAAAEFGRVLRPGGVVGLLWNIRDARVPWMGALQDLIGGEDTLRRVAAESTQRMAGGDLVNEERAGIEEIAEFLPGVQRASFPHTVAMTPSGVLDLVSTYSYVRLSPRCAEILAAVRELLATHPDTAGRDVVDVAYVTAAYRWRRP